MSINPCTTSHVADGTEIVFSRSIAQFGVAVRCRFGCVNLLLHQDSSRLLQHGMATLFISRVSRRAAKLFPGFYNADTGQLLDIQSTMAPTTNGWVSLTIRCDWPCFHESMCTTRGARQNGVFLRKLHAKYCMLSCNRISRTHILQAELPLEPAGYRIVCNCCRVRCCYPAMDNIQYHICSDG